MSLLHFREKHLQLKAPAVVRTIREICILRDANKMVIFIGMLKFFGLHSVAQKHHTILFHEAYICITYAGLFSSKKLITVWSTD